MLNNENYRVLFILGKFLFCMQTGLPTLAIANPGIDMVSMIPAERVGKICTDASVHTLLRMAEEFIDEIADDVKMQSHCKALGEKLFSPEAAISQIIESLRR